MTFDVDFKETGSEFQVSFEEPENFETNMGEVVEVEGEGVKDHNKLFNRDMANQHPMSSISGLENKLGNTVNKGDLTSISFTEIDTVFSGVLRRRLK